MSGLPPARRSPWGRRGLAVLALGCLWPAAWLHWRHGLQLENHLRGNLSVPFQPVGRPALHPDGRAFVVTDNGQLVALSRTGQLLWNKHLPGAVTPQPVLVSAALLVLQGAGALHGYTPGGELTFSTPGGGVGDLPCADEAGGIYLIDRQGALVGLDDKGQPRFRTSLGWRGPHQGMVLADGRILFAGVPPGRPGEVVLAERNGAVTLRLPLPAAPVGVAPALGGGALVSTAGEVLGLGVDGRVGWRVALPCPALSAPLPAARAGEAISVLCSCPGGVELVHLVGGPAGAVKGGVIRRVALGKVPQTDGLPAAVLRGRDGLVYAAFVAGGGPWPTYHGVLAIGAGGVAWRQDLPAVVTLGGLTLDWGGGVVAVARGERYLWQFEGGSEADRGAYHPWPMPTGNPAGSSRPWPERP